MTWEGFKKTTTSNQLLIHLILNSLDPNPLLTFHEQVLDHQISDVHMPDVNLIGEMGDVTELGKLVQLVLGCAVSCEKKQGEVWAVKQTDHLWKQHAGLPDHMHPSAKTPCC